MCDISDFSNKIVNFESTIKDTKYSNLIIDKDCHINAPSDISSVSTFKLRKKENLSSSEISEYLETVLPYLEEDSLNIKDELRIISDSIPVNPNSPYPYSLKLLSNISDDSLTDINTYVIGSSDYYLECKPSGSLNIFNDGKAQAFDNIQPSCAGIYFATGTHSIEKKYDDLTSMDQYNVIDDIISINDAVNTTEELINNNFSFNANEKLQASIVSAKVVDMNNGVYGLSFDISCLYNGIQFDVYKTETDGQFTELSTTNQERKRYNPDSAKLNPPSTIQNSVNMVK